MGPFSGEEPSPRSSPRSITRPTAVGQSVQHVPAKRSVQGSDEFGCPQAFLVKQVIDRRISLLVHRRRDFLPHPLDHVNEARGWPLRRHIHRSWRPPCPRACRPRPGVSHRAQEGQGCADHDVSGRRRAAEAPRVAQKPRTSLTIALTDTAASGPELQRRPCATSRRRGRYPPLRIRRSRTGIGRHAREQRPDGRCNLVASRPRRAAGSAHSGDSGLRVGESGDSRPRNSPRARVGANSLADGARAAPFVSGRPWGTATRSAITRPGMSSWPTPAPPGQRDA